MSRMKRAKKLPEKENKKVVSFFKSKTYRNIAM